MRPFLLILLIAVFFDMSVHAQTSYGKNQRAGHYLSTRQIRIYYEEYGKGEPLIFLHGNGGSIADFKNNIPYFAAHYHVIAIDSRSHGQSKDNGDSLSFEMMADDFNALLDSLHLDSCMVIGWSDGGIDGLLLAMRHPDKVKKLAITGANLWPDTTALTPYVFEQIQKNSAGLRKKNQTQEVKTALKISDLDLKEPHIMAGQLQAVRCPTLVIGGDHDVIPVLHTVLIASSIQQSYLWIIPHAGHSTPVFEKDLFNLTVWEFFKKPYHRIEGPDTFR